MQGSCVAEGTACATRTKMLTSAWVQSGTVLDPPLQPAIDTLTIAASVTRLQRIT